MRGIGWRRGFFVELRLGFALFLGCEIVGLGILAAGVFRCGLGRSRFADCELRRRVR